MEQADTHARPSLGDALRANAVPLLLITLGALFLIDYRGGPMFHQTWPILLIVGGAIWAVSHLLRPSEPENAAPARMDRDAQP